MDRTPPEFQVWHNQYLEALRALLSSQMRDTGAIRKMAESLRCMLERCPEQAKLVRRLTALACLMIRKAGAPDEIAEIARIGVEAETLEPEPREQPELLGIILLCLAEAQLAADQRIAGLDTLNRLAKRLPEMGGGAMGCWLSARQSYQRGALLQAGLDNQRSRDCFAQAAEDAAKVLDGGLREAFIAAWQAALFGDTSGFSQADRDGFSELAVLDLEQTHVGAAIGTALTTPPEPDRDKKAQAVGEAWLALRNGQAPPGLDPFDFVPLIGALPVEQAKAFGDWLADTVPGEVASANVEALSRSLTDPASRAAIDGILQQLEERRQNARLGWQMAAQLGLPRACQSAGDHRRAREIRMATLKEAMQHRSGMPQAIAWADSLVAQQGEKAPDIARQADTLLFILGVLITASPDVFERPHVWARFDASLRLVASVAMARTPQDESSRRTASIALDLLRSRHVPPATALAPLGEGSSPAMRGAAEAADTLGRLQVALADRTDAVSIVVQSLEDGTGFLVLTGENIQFCTAGPEFLASAGAMDDAAFAANFGSSDALVRAGQAAFQALPEAVRTAIAGYGTILIAPDFSAGRDELPFELMHDGTAHLCETKIIARCTSLHDMARVLETPDRAPRRSRAIIASASEVAGYPPLPVADLERRAIRDLFETGGYDAPDVDQQRLSPEYLVERLSYIDVLHIAGHGEAGAGMEWLPLPNGTPLVVEDVLRRPQRSIPFIYLNTCLIGKTRYLGGGVSRGLAYDFLNAGAPAVVANTVEVLDETAAKLAIAFHRAALGKPVGAALRDARLRLKAEGISPAAYGHVLLFGSPWHALPGAAAEKEINDIAGRLLDAYFSPSPGDGEREDAWRDATGSLQNRPSQPRLAAAMELIESVSSITDLGDSGQASELDRAILLADALAHPAAGAMIRLIGTNAALEAKDPAAGALLEDLIPRLASLAAFDEAWKVLHVRLRAEKKRLEFWRSGLQPGQVLGDADPADQEVMDALQDVILGTQGIAEDETGATALRTEGSVEDVAWNAVVMGHPNRFQDAREITQFCSLLSQKLARRGDLKTAAQDHAPAALSGLLRAFWWRQKLTHLEPQLAEGQAGAVMELLADLNMRWAAADRPGWVSAAVAFADRIDERLAYLDTLSWEDVTRQLKLTIAALADEALKILDATNAGHPEGLPSAAAYLSGLLIVKNSFSPLQGSVPESFDDELTKAWERLDGDNEARFMPYLTKGFERAANRRPDELERWRLA